MAFHWQRTATLAEDGLLLRDVLRGKMGISRRLLHTLKFQGQITINGVPATVRARVKAGDVIALHLEETAELRVVPERLPLSIVYEDQDLLVVEKPAGMIVHPIPPEPSGTLANAIAWHWRQCGFAGPVRVITRLDRDTTGLVLVAKNALVQYQYTQGGARLQKRYLALVHGRPDMEQGVIDVPIAVNPDNPVTRKADAGGKPAQTAWRVRKRFDQYTLVEAELLTGRTHQIRVHLAWIGHPLLGDRQYGGEQRLIDRQALHCHSLRLQHCRSGELWAWRSPLPADMASLCAEI
ncbi:MAG: RluA family pseudouridine synthase [Bacillota bacterium]|jgi:23S rRNA pseudouridine1911/1915/1917 synthase